MANFNFLPPKRVESEADSLKRLQLTRSSVLFLAITLILGALAFGIGFFQKRQIADLTTEKTNLEVVLNSAQDTLKVLAQVHRKTAGINFILTSQFNYSDAFKNFFQLLPSGISVQTIDLAADGKLKTTLTASSSGTLIELVDKVTRPDNNYSSIKLGDIKSDTDEGYRLELDMTIGRK